MRWFKSAQNAVTFFVMDLGSLFLKVPCTGILKLLRGKIKNQYIPDILGHNLERSSPLGQQ